MRKKFRVWDLQDKKFYYSDKGYQGHYVLSLDGKVQVSPGTNIAPYPSAAKRLKWFRKAASQSLTSAE